MTYRLSPKAESDLDEIWRYTLQQWSLDQANRYYRDIVNACALLAADQKMGRQVDVRPGYWKYPSGSHFIYFRRGKGTIEIIRILHQRMDVPRHL